MATQILRNKIARAIYRFDEEGIEYAEKLADQIIQQVERSYAKRHPHGDAAFCQMCCDECRHGNCKEMCRTCSALREKRMAIKKRSKGQIKSKRKRNG